MEATELQIVEVEKPLAVEDLVRNVNLIQQVMKQVMKDGEHYGVIPGCGKKPSLLKPGAEKLALTFRLDPEFEETVLDLGKGHREYRIKTTIYSIGSGRRLGSGVGSASTMETKWRFKGGSKELIGDPVPAAYWNLVKTDMPKAKELIGGPAFSVAKNPDTGKWEIAIIGENVEHDNPADFYNTVYKMAKKRSLIDAILTVTGASDLFTQDTEEMVDNGVMGGEKAKDVTPEKDQKKAESAETKTPSNGTPPVPGEQKQPSGEPAQTNGNTTISEPQVKLLYVKIKQSTTTEEGFKQKYGIAHMKEFPKSQMEEALKYLEGNKQ